MKNTSYWCKQNSHLTCFSTHSEQASRTAPSNAPEHAAAKHLFGVQSDVFPLILQQKQLALQHRPLKARRAKQIWWAWVSDSVHFLLSNSHTQRHTRGHKSYYLKKPISCLITCSLFAELMVSRANVCSPFLTHTNVEKLENITSPTRTLSTLCSHKYWY